MINTKTTIIAITIIAALTITSLTGFENNKVYAEGTTYKMANDLTAVLTFTFRDGVEVHEFPVFMMTEDYLDNKATTFEVQGVLLDNAPHLFEALDDAYKYRQVKKTAAYSGYEYDYRYFDIDVDFANSSEIVRTLHYSDCQINDYVVKTLLDNYEGYFGTKTGFAIINDIEFACGGVDTSKVVKTAANNKDRTMYEGSSSTDSVTDYGTTRFDYANGVRTYVTFNFDHGVERIQFPIFEMTSGFDTQSTPSFHVEGIVGKYPMLAKAINKARDVSKEINSVYNNDFQAKVEFVHGTLMDGEKLLREIDYADCRFTGATISTQYDKEEGWTGKSGFAIVDQLDVECAGQEPVNPNYHQVYGNAPIWKTSTGATPIVHEELDNNFNMGTGPHAVATFYFEDNTIEVIDFPIFNQHHILGKSFPTFDLQGLVGDYPMLYKRVDKNAEFTKLSGTNQGVERFNVDVNLMYNDQKVRGYEYSQCRNVNYAVETNHNKEESFFKGFALENVFEFECFGYKPDNPVYEAMFVYDKADTLSSVDLRETQSWSDVYKYNQ